MPTLVGMRTSVRTHQSHYSEELRDILISYFARMCRMCFRMRARGSHLQCLYIVIIVLFVSARAVDAAAQYV